jgi:hypothetical protein
MKAGSRDVCGFLANFFGFFAESVGFFADLSIFGKIEGAVFNLFKSSFALVLLEVVPNLWYMILCLVFGFKGVKEVHIKTTWISKSKIKYLEYRYLRYKRCCGSGSAFLMLIGWIRIRSRIGNADPDPGGQKGEILDVLF